MDPRKLSQASVKIKTEPISPKKVSLPGAMAPQLIKRESVSRLPSFKPPRDLSLSGSSSSQSIPNLNNFMPSGSKAGKRVYMPNINVIRKKGNSNTSASNDSSSQSDARSKNKEQQKRPLNNKKKSINVVQTKGVFSEGLAPGKVRAHTESEGRRQSETSVMEKPKLNLTKRVSKKEEDDKLKSLLRDDFIDDADRVPDITFIPNSLPIVYNIKTKHDPNDIEKTFEYLHVKTEKVLEQEVKDDGRDVLSIFEESDRLKMLLFEFPGVLPEKEDSTEKKKQPKGQTNEADSKSKVKPGGLSNLGEGLWGCLRIHENGKAYFVLGKHVIPVVLTRHQSRQELMSTNIDSTQNKGEVINLGTIDATFTCSTNFFQGVS